MGLLTITWLRHTERMSSNYSKSRGISGTSARGILAGGEPASGELVYAVALVNSACRRLDLHTAVVARPTADGADGRDIAELHRYAAVEAAEQLVYTECLGLTDEEEDHLLCDLGTWADGLGDALRLECHGAEWSLVVELVEVYR